MDIYVPDAPTDGNDVCAPAHDRPRRTLAPRRRGHRGCHNRIGCPCYDGFDRPLRHAARVGDRPLQPALPLLHARGGIRLAAAGGPADASRKSIGWPGSSSALGVARVRLTGGEPLLRRDLPGLVAPARRARPGLRERALTTNGVHLAAHRRRRCALPGSIASPSASTRCDADRFDRLSRSRDLAGRPRRHRRRRRPRSARSRSTPS